MSDFSTVESLYRKMHGISEQMLIAAEEQEWDSLIRLELERSEIVAVLQSMQPEPPEEQSQRDSLISLIKEIQQYDELLRPMIKSWMADLRSMFESAGNELKLGRQYGNL